MKRSLNMYSPARTSVTPLMCSKNSAVGVEPTETTGAGKPAARKQWPLDRSGAFAFGHLANRANRTTVIGLAGVSQHALQFHCGAARQLVTELKQQRRTRVDSAAMRVDIQLDEHRHFPAGRSRRLGEQARRLDVVHDNRQLRPTADQADDVRQLAGSDPHRVHHVPHAVLEKIFSLLQHRNRDATSPLVEDTAHHVDRLRCLSVRPQHDTELTRALAHTSHVAIRGCPGRAAAPASRCSDGG